MDATLVEAKIDCTEGLFKREINNDDDAQKLKHLGQKFNDFFQMSETTIDEFTTKYHNDLKREHKEK